MKKWLIFVMLIGIAHTEPGDIVYSSSPEENSTEQPTLTLTPEQMLQKVGEAYKSHHYDDAIAYAQAACNAGNATACGALGNLYSSDLEEMKNKKNLKLAADAYFRACQGNVGAACFYLGVFHSNGTGVQQNYHSAKGFFARACELNDPEGCDALGNFFANPDPKINPKQDYTQAATYYLKSCNSEKGAMSCFKLGTLYELGQGVKKDITIAKDFYGKSCKLGNTNGCDAYWSIDGSQKGGNMTQGNSQRR
ncbi:hypothetical protein CCZ01_02840 [Helicobacter monodelphidis]|uniref:tetratricopeptide repeat protein n=1 Tax=Helicobacter sp. 15-1451 TaxID=2004995 RepID=UPI000DCC2A5B|nr:tetratricopeptide repeat protein [Helicobacter sp. 15-1451]RAX58370.1 hypothetical protein CCZ01_02840 [Helicobacter sp. 15-1451]